MDPYEQSILSKCFNDWKDNNFKNDQWKCNVSSTSGRRRRNAVPVCSTCLCEKYPAGGSCLETGSIFHILIPLAVGSFQLIQNVNG